MKNSKRAILCMVLVLRLLFYASASMKKFVCKNYELDRFICNFEVKLI